MRSFYLLNNLFLKWYIFGTDGVEQCDIFFAHPNCVVYLSQEGNAKYITCLYSFLSLLCSCTISLS
jgi:hypothetical protein